MRLLSLGAGVQSSTIALMIVHGEIEPVSAGIFANTQCEPSYVYRWLNYLKSILTFPIYKVSRGNLGEDFLNALGSEKGRCGQPPFFVRNPANRDEGGMLWRQCTSEYKLDVIRRKVRELMKNSGEKKVDQLIGISTDEAHRMKDSRVKYITNVYPLIDLRMSRQHCLDWLRDHGYPIPEKSACVFCPYRSNANWREMKRQYPEEFVKAVTYDQSLRNGNRLRVAAGIKGELFVHRSMTPLDEAILGPHDTGFQMDLFGNECEGMCGV